MQFIVPDGKRALRLFLREPAPSVAYAVRATPDWNTKTKMVNKKTYGFTLRFSEPAPPEGGVVGIEVPGFQIYTAAEMVHEQNRRNRQAWQALTANQSSQVAREMEERLQEVRRRAELTLVPGLTVRDSDGRPVYRCIYCSAQGIGLEWARNHHHATVQAPLIAPVEKTQRIKKKKREKNPRLKALVNATIGG